jgi:hypothetical protein
MTSSTGSGRTADDDLFVLVMVGFLALGGVVASAGVWWAEAVRWLLAHQVLVAGDHPLLRLPGSGGAGLDLPRLALATAALLLLTAAAVGALRRHPRRLRGEPR